jgi:hypothetical protein
VEADVVGTAILALMGQVGEESGAACWEGSCKELKNDLEKLIEERVRKSQAWPGTPRGLSGRLRRLVTVLRESGINIIFHPKGTKGQRTLSITRMAPYSTATNAVTAKGELLCGLNQPAATEKEGGGPSCGAVDGPPLQPPPGPTFANQLNDCAPATRSGEGGESGGCLHSLSGGRELTSSGGPRD